MDADQELDEDNILAQRLLANAALTTWEATYGATIAQTLGK